MQNIKRKIKKVLRKTAFYRAFHKRRNEQQYKAWLEAGMPIPTPQKAKAQTIKTLAKKYNIRTFVETGTCLGDTVDAVRNDFEKIYSIELGEELFEDAQDRFSNSLHIFIVQGDSGVVLGEVISNIDCPILFWLDGHYSGDITAKADLDTPILKELLHIAYHPLKSEHIILIDDARHFVGRGDYPSLETLRQWAQSQSYNTFEIENDMIRIFNQ